MNLQEAIHLLKNNNYIVESEEFNEFDAKKLGKQVKLNSARPTHSMRYEDDKRYNDFQGRKWLNVKSRDEATLISAILDGLTDTMRIEGDIEYQDIKTEEDLYDAYEENLDYIIDILYFLRQHMHGQTTVYRGFNFNSDDYHSIISQNKIKFKHELLRFLDNTNKEFNSFSTSPIISKGFAQKWHANDYVTGVPVMIAAEVEPNDINFAFTAYLMGRHGGMQEYELNINNLKQLKNIRIVSNINAECYKFAKKIAYDIEKKIKNYNKETDDLCDNILNYTSPILEGPITLDEYNLPGKAGKILIRNKKEVVCNYDQLIELEPNLYILQYNNVAGNKANILYNAKTNCKSEEYYAIHKSTNPLHKYNLGLVIAKYNNYDFALVNTKTCKPISFNKKIENIIPIPANNFGRKDTPWNNVEYYTIKFNDGFTMVNNEGKCVFTQEPYEFRLINPNLDQLLFTATTKDGKSILRFELKKDGTAKNTGKVTHKNGDWTVEEY